MLYWYGVCVFLLTIPRLISTKQICVKKDMNVNKHGTNHEENKSQYWSNIYIYVQSGLQWWRLGTGEDSQSSIHIAAHCVLMWRIRGCPFDGGRGSHVIIRKTWPWTIVSNVFWEYHAPCRLKLLLNFEKE